jgi:hypothetical protein
VNEKLTANVRIIIPQIISLRLNVFNFYFLGLYVCEAFKNVKSIKKNKVIPYYGQRKLIGRKLIKKVKSVNINKTFNVYFLGLYVCGAF